jgi:hypothetical protein
VFVPTHFVLARTMPAAERGRSASLRPAVVKILTKPGGADGEDNAGKDL